MTEEAVNGATEQPSEENNAENAVQPGYVKFTTKADQTPGARQIELTWNIGKDVQESVDMFGAEVVKNMFDKSLVIAAQATIRRMLAAENEDHTPKYTDEQIADHIYNHYKPGVRQTVQGGGVSKKAMEKVVADLLKLSQEERIAKLKELGILS